MAAFQTFTAQLTRSTDLSQLTKHLEFQIRGVQRFGFVPGQWLSFKTTKADGEEITRAYSIASPPGDDGRFALCLNRVQDGFMSNFICDMKEGDEVGCQGPFGDFILRPPMRDTIFIATGTGIAPIRSMLLWMLSSNSDRRERPPSIEQPQLWLVFGSRTEEDIYYHDEFRHLSMERANFHYMPTLSRGSDGWAGLRGYVQQHVPAIAQGRSDMHAYICGLEKMVKSTRELLKSLGWDRKSILYEKYD